jgi:hypothetical protein
MHRLAEYKMTVAAARAAAVRTRLKRRGGDVLAGMDWDFKRTKKMLQKVNETSVHTPREGRYMCMK